MRRALTLVLVLPALIAACGPIPVGQAERDCLADARLAQQPRGEVKLGFGSDGRIVRQMDVDISSDFITGRDPEKVWQSCVLNRSGQLPTRPYSSL
jgi:hypothetical protein